MLSYPYWASFESAAYLEYNELFDRGTFVLVSKNEAKEFIIPMHWVFTYKFDEEGYLIKFKARLVVYSDLQPKRDKEMYTIILATRVFCFLMALIVYFNLEAIQFNAVNTFPNARLNRLV